MAMHQLCFIDCNIELSNVFIIHSSPSKGWESIHWSKKIIVNLF